MTASSIPKPNPKRLILIVLDQSKCIDLVKDDKSAFVTCVGLKKQQHQPRIMFESREFEFIADFYGSYAIQMKNNLLVWVFPDPHTRPIDNYS